MLNYVPSLPATITTAFKSYRDFWGVLKTSKKAKVDSVLFHLHSVVTVIILMIGAGFLTMTQYFGKPIQCLMAKDSKEIPIIEHYCWIEGIFSYVNLNEDAKGPQSYQGIGPRNDGDMPVYHKYYQWVYFVLIIQAILFYCPKYLWKNKKASRFDNLVTRLQASHVYALDEYNQCHLLQDVADSLYLGSNYCNTYFLIELSYLIHLVLQIWFTNIFLAGAFLTLGLDWYQFAQSPRNRLYDPLIRIFPRLAKCNFHTFGYSGTAEIRDALCFLPLNTINEKLYVVLWFWFAFLFVITVIHVIFQMLLFLPYYRYLRLKWVAPSLKPKNCRLLVRSIGNWFILEMLATNMKPSHFIDLVHLLKEYLFDKNGNHIYVSHLSKVSKLSSKYPQMKVEQKESKSSGSKSGKKKVGWNVTVPTSTAFSTESSNDWPTSTESAPSGWNNTAATVDWSTDTTNCDSVQNTSKDNDWNTEKPSQDLNEPCTWE